MYQFLFDINKCVGCAACAVACAIENKTEPPLSWRNINTYNEFQLPEIPLFHYSLACNHCEKAPCLLNCPALAYSKDLVTGAVIHAENKCIGCKYCTWTCPFDAPKFNLTKQVVEKCTFCNPRIKEGLKPACANLCPTGALDFGLKNTEAHTIKVPAFNHLEINPSIEFIPLRKVKNTPEIVNNDNENAIINYIPVSRLPEPKITARKESSLVFFTLLIPVLSGSFAASIFNQFQVNPYLFLGIGFLGMILSSLHLGKKGRAYRAIFNLKNSWLSREIFSFSAFVGFAFLHWFVLLDCIAIQYLAVLFSILALVSVDFVYKLAVQKNNRFINSAQVLFSAVLFYALFAQNLWFLVFITSVKFGLYILNNYTDFLNFQLKKSVFKMLRLILLFSIVLLFIDAEKYSSITFICLILSELIDRVEFYNGLKITNVKLEMLADLQSKTAL
jgi:Fe-S-cluster-containing dehydrogenase component/DMSO reductase anchor subunit